MLGSGRQQSGFGFVVVLAAVALLVSVSLTGQESKQVATAKYQFKVGLIPFIDNTMSGGAEVGVAVSRAVQAELTHSTDLIGRAIKLDDVAPEDVDGEKAVQIGRARSVDVVLIGTVLDATAEQSDKNVQSPSILGQSVGGGSRSVKAAVTLQGDLYSVADGKLIESIRVTGRASETKLGADVYTTLGSVSTGGSSFQDSAIGKALTSAVAELVKRIAADQKKMTPYKKAGKDG